MKEDPRIVAELNRAKGYHKRRMERAMLSVIVLMTVVAIAGIITLEKRKEYVMNYIAFNQ